LKTLWRREGEKNHSLQEQLFSFLMPLLYHLKNQVTGGGMKKSFTELSIFFTYFIKIFPLACIADRGKNSYTIFGNI